MIIVSSILFLQPKNLIALDSPQHVEQKVYTKQELQKVVYQYAKEYNVDGDKMIKLIDCENRPWNPELQSGLTYKEGNRWGKPAGSREESYGLAQIHLPDHKDVTKEEAQDPEFAIEFMAKNWNKVTWSCR